MQTDRFWELFDKHFQRNAEGKWEADPGGLQAVSDVLYRAGGSFPHWKTRGTHTQPALGDYAILHFLTQVAYGSSLSRFPRPGRYGLKQVVLKPLGGNGLDIADFLLRPRRHGAQAFSWLMITQPENPGGIQDSDAFFQPEGDERLIAVVQRWASYYKLQLTLTDDIPERVHAAAVGAVKGDSMVVYPLPTDDLGVRVAFAKSEWRRQPPVTRALFDAVHALEDAITKAPGEQSIGSTWRILSGFLARKW